MVDSPNELAFAWQSVMLECGWKYSCHVLRPQCATVIFPTPTPKDCAPYDKGAFRVELIFPAEYPFKPPRITFKTKIYHPNVDEKGQVCLPIISAENWKPATRTDQGETGRRGRVTALL